MSIQTQTLMEKLVTEIDTKNSWGKNQLVETTIKIYRGINVSDNELIVFSNFIATVSTKNSWGKNELGQLLADTCTRYNNTIMKKQLDLNDPENTKENIIHADFPAVSNPHSQPAPAWQHSTPDCPHIPDTGVCQWPWFPG